MRSGQTATVHVALVVGGMTEQVQVSAESPIVDTRSATTGQDITLQLTESLPTGRSYQSYLQLVPGVMPDDPKQPGNPASKSGINYSDIGGDIGVSTDNFYYFNGINVTDPVTGTFGANLNTEIIQEQKVLTGGIPAEFVGAPGLLSNVITKSGSNTFHGSVNYFFQNDDLVAENKNSALQEFSTYDARFTFGGPIVRDRAWFFGSYRRLEREDDVTSLDTKEFLRTVEEHAGPGLRQGHVGADAERHGQLHVPERSDGHHRPARARHHQRARPRRVQGGNRYSVNYSRLLGAVALRRRPTTSTTAKSRTSRSFARRRTRSSSARPTSARWPTSSSAASARTSSTSATPRACAARCSGTWRRHTFKGGVEWSRNDNFRDTALHRRPAVYVARSPASSGLTAGELATGLVQRPRLQRQQPSDFNGFITTINAPAEPRAVLRRVRHQRRRHDHGGRAGTAADVQQHGRQPERQVNYYRTLQSQDGPQETRSDGLSFFVQDQFTLRPLHVQPRRARRAVEALRHARATNIFTFDWACAPRLSAVYDVLGDGRQKASATTAATTIPIRNNMTNFAGTLSGLVREEQVFVNGQWVTYRTRGGLVQQDAFFAPTTKTPYTDDLQLGYQIDLGRNMSLEATYTNRRTRDILEDYDLALFAYSTTGTTDYPGPIDDPQSLFLGLDYFGYAQNPGLELLHRDAERRQAQLQRRRAGVPQALQRQLAVARVLHLQRRQGQHELRLERRLPGRRALPRSARAEQYRQQPGRIQHLFKVGGSYHLPVGIQLGAALSAGTRGTVASRTALASRPQPADPGRRAVRLRRRHRTLGDAGRGRLAAESVVGHSSTCARSTSSGSRTSAPSSSSTSSTC